MSYKGEDLDLRTPREPAAPAARGQDHLYIEPTYVLAGREAALRNRVVPGPIWVDDTLLSCANHAYDVALAHRAGEVRIEHLLYALTRNDAAADVLERHGVMDAGLRRESAMLIASSSPASTIADRLLPRGSAAFEEALRLAAARAYQQNRPAGVADLLTIFCVVRPDLDGLDLLRRHMRHLSNGHAMQMHFTPLLASPGSYVRAATPNGVISHQPVNSVKPTPGPMGSPNMPNPTDTIQNSRIDALEQMVRALTEQLTTANMRAQNLHSQAPHWEPPPPQPPPFVREQPQPGYVTASLDTGQLDILAQQLAAMTQRLEAVEAQLRLANSRPQPQAADMATLEERMADLIGLIKSRGADGVVDLSPIDNRLSDIEVALLSRDEETDVGGKVADQLDQFESNLMSRIEVIEKALNSERLADEESAAAFGAEIKAMAGALATHAASGERLHLALRERLDAIDASLSETDKDGDRFDENLAKLNTNQHVLAESFDRWQVDLASDLRQISDTVQSVADRASLDSANIERLSERLSAMYRVTVERYHRRNRLWYWLFGTDDWIGASWPSQTARVEEELKALKRDLPA